MKFTRRDANVSTSKAFRVPYSSVVKIVKKVIVAFAILVNDAGIKIYWKVHQCNAGPPHLP